MFDSFSSGMSSVLAAVETQTQGASSAMKRDSFKAASPAKKKSPMGKAVRKAGATGSIAYSEAAAGERADNTWSKAEASTFFLRAGPNYASSGKKEPSRKALFDLVGVDCVETDAKIDNIGSQMEIPEEWLDVESGCKGVPQLFIVNVQLPSEFPNTIFKEITDGPGYSLVLYYKMTKETADAMADVKTISGATKLFADYCSKAPEMADDSTNPFRGRFKITLRCDNIDEFGLPSFITSYNSKPVLIRNTGTLVRGEKYIEMDINVHKFGSVPKKALQMLISRFDKMYINVGFCIESREDSEMPEVLFGVAALNKPSVVAPEW